MGRFRVLIALATLITASESRADHELIWKLKPGQELVFSQSFTSTTQENNGPESRNIRVNTIHWRVERVEPDGSAQVTQSLKRVKGQRPQYVLGQRSKIEIIDFDSDEVYPANSPQARILEIDRKRIEFGDFSFTLTPQGEARDLIDSEKLRQFRVSAGGKFFDHVFTEDVLRILIPSVPLPKGEFKIGTSWVEKPKFNYYHIPAEVIGITCRAAETIERDGHQLDQVQFEVETKDFKLSPAPFSVKNKELRCWGRFLFDPSAGRMMEWRRETIENTVMSLMGHDTLMKMRSTIVTSLLPPAEKPAR